MITNRVQKLVDNVIDKVGELPLALIALIGIAYFGSKDAKAIDPQTSQPADAIQITPLPVQTTSGVFYPDGGFGAEIRVQENAVAR